MVKKALALFVLLVCSAWSVLAQQAMPERESQRVYMPFSEAAEKMIAAAVARSKPGQTENITQEESYRRIVEYAKQAANKANADIGGNAFSYMSFLPYHTSKLYGEVASYTFNYGSITVTTEREAGAFTYRMAPVAPATYTLGNANTQGRIYDPDLNHAFKTMPRLVGTTLSSTNLCTSSTAACSVLSAYTQGQFKWHYRDSGQPYMVACNDVSDCVRASANMLFYTRTFTYRRTGYDNFGQYWGNYQITPSGNCNDSSEYAWLRASLMSGVLCMFSERYNYTTGFNAERFTVAGDFESNYLRYIALTPLPVVCPTGMKYPQVQACDARFVNDVLTLDSLVRLVDRMYFYGTQRAGYRGVKYTIVSKADAVAVLQGRFVKVSSLTQQVQPPTPVMPAAPASSPGSNTPSPSLDLGSDPAIGQPAIESITASSILSPIWGLFPSLSAWSPGNYAISCPVFTPSVFGAVLQINEHCQLLEGQRVALGVLSLVAWASAALLVVLRA